MPDRATAKRTHHHDVFISSTSLDLPDHRKAAIDAVWRSNMYPLAMEKDAAVSANAIEYSLGLVNEAEVYIGIFAHRYGHIPTGHKISITEMEYRRAAERDIPILIFIMHKDHPLTAGDVETGAGAKKIEKLKKELQSKYVVAYFKSAEDLAALIIQALHDPRLVEKLVPLSATPETATPHRVRTIPTPPEAYIAHPYTMRQEDFFGRTAELGKLDAWAASEDTTLVVEAIGGVGKSALTWQWLQTRRAASAIPGLAGAVWFSFYESDATIDRFARETLAYVTDRPPDDLKGLSRYEVEAQLFAALRAQPYLLVLDGIERILVAYHRMDAPQVTDEEVEEEAEQRQEDVRRCTDPRHAEFLCKLIGCAPSKVLISTRLFPRDLADRHDAHRYLPGVGHLHLNGLNPDDAVALIRHRGVNGTATDLKRFMDQFGYHSLLIGAVAGRIANYFPAPGDFAKWHVDEGKDLQLSGLELKQKRTEILHYALDGLSPEQAKLLSQIAAFRYPVEYEALSALNPYAPPKPEEVEEPNLEDLETYQEYLRDDTEKQRAAQNDEEWERWQQDIEEDRQGIAEEEAKQAAYTAYQEALRAYEASPEMREARSRFHADLSALEARGLLQWDRAANRYDLHPVVRGYAFERLEGDDRSATFERIRDYFDGLPPENLDTAQEVADLRRSLEIYHALLGAGRLDDAARFYNERLSNVLIYHVAAYPMIIELLAPFFTKGLDQPPALVDPSRQSHILNDLSLMLYYTGQTNQTLVLYDLAIGLFLESDEAVNVGIVLINYAISLTTVNRLATVLRARELIRDLVEATGNTHGLALSQINLLRSYGNTGQWVNAEATYQRFNEAPSNYKHEYWQAVAERFWAETLIARRLDADEALDRAWSLSIQSRNHLGQHHTLHLRGEAALQDGRPDAAAEYFEEAIALARRSGIYDVWIYQGRLAHANAKLGRQTKARELIEETLVQAIAEKHDIYVSAAEVYLALGETDLARQHALRAYENAWADGPPFVWWWDLQRAKAVLAALGEPEPSLPPFDPAKVEPIPHEAEIRALIEKLRAEKAAREVEAGEDSEAGR